MESLSRSNEKNMAELLKYRGVFLLNKDIVVDFFQCIKDDHHQRHWLLQSFSSAFFSVWKFSIMFIFFILRWFLKCQVLCPLSKKKQKKTRGNRDNYIYISLLVYKMQNFLRKHKQNSAHMSLTKIVTLTHLTGNFYNFHKIGGTGDLGIDVC